METWLDICPFKEEKLFAALWESLKKNYIYLLQVLTKKEKLSQTSTTFEKGSLTKPQD